MFLKADTHFQRDWIDARYDARGNYCAAYQTIVRREAWWYECEHCGRQVRVVDFLGIGQPTEDFYCNVCDHEIGVN